MSHKRRRFEAVLAGARGGSDAGSSSSDEDERELQHGEHAAHDSGQRQLDAEEAAHAHDDGDDDDDDGGDDDDGDDDTAARGQQQQQRAAADAAAAPGPPRHKKLHVALGKGPLVCHVRRVAAPPLLPAAAAWPQPCCA
jgi:hypothetical protein